MTIGTMCIATGPETLKEMIDENETYRGTMDARVAVSEHERRWEWAEERNRLRKETAKKGTTSWTASKEEEAKEYEKATAEARGLFCYWAVRELGYSMVELAGHLGMSQPGVVYAVRRGKRIATERGLELLHRVN